MPSRQYSDHPYQWSPDGPECHSCGFVHTLPNPPAEDDVVPPQVDDQIHCGAAGFDYVAEVLRYAGEGVWIVRTAAGLTMEIIPGSTYAWACFGLAREHNP